jgi:transcription termination factor Rho
MTAEQQLERSVLEGKERDELNAIAQAMSLKTTTRTKKADIIDQILDATGVTSGSNGASPAASANGGDGADRAAPAGDLGDSGAAASGASPGGPAAPADATASEAGPTATATTTTADSGPAVFVEPPELADGADTGTQTPQRQNGQPSQGNRNRNQSQTRNQPDGEVGNRRSRRRRGRDRGGQGGELQGGGQEQPYTGELVEVKGLLDLRDEGYGFLRCEGYLPSNKDVYVSISQARKFALRRGDYVEGACRPASNNEKYPALLRIDTVSGLDPEAARNRPKFEDLTPLFPDSRLNLEMVGDKDNLTARIVDLLSPIGKGQRGMIVSPPKAGKTTVMKQIAHSIEANNPEVHLMVLLVDERPEEVTDMRRTVKGEVVASTFDRPSEEHTQVAELAIERAKRLVEMGRDVVIILDGITRLARAYNLAAPATGRIMSGGVDSGALYPPKKFFGAARNVEEGGSLTILASALVETGSKMDEVIFEEFKGTGNMELRLDRRLSERRLYPAIDVNASSTRHEELLFERGQLQQVWKLRRVLNALASDGKDAAGLELLMDKIRTTTSNDEFLAEIAKGPGT